MQPDERLRLGLRVAGAALATIAALMVVLGLRANTLLPLFNWACVGLCGACLFRIPWDYAITGTRIGGWVMVLLGTPFCFLMDGPLAKLAFVAIVATGSRMAEVIDEDALDEA